MLYRVISPVDNSGTLKAQRRIRRASGNSLSADYIAYRIVKVSACPSA